MGAEKTSIHLDKRMIAKELRIATQTEGSDARGKNASLLDCGAPLFEVPPSDLFERRPQGFRAASETLFRRSAWLMCTTLHALNSGLRDYRRRHCSDPSGAEVLRARPLAVQVADLFTVSLPKRSHVSLQSDRISMRLNASRRNE